MSNGLDSFRTYETEGGVGGVYQHQQELWGALAERLVRADVDVVVGVLPSPAPLQSRRLEQRIDAVADVLASTRTELRTDVAELRTELAEVRRDLHALAERVARVEGALTGPWRPTNGSPAAAPKGPPEATAE